MPNTIEKFTRQDRDMIIVLNEKVDNIKQDIKELKDTTLTRVEGLESRVEKLENNRSWVIGAFSLAGVLAMLITYIYFSDINAIKKDLDKHILQTEAK